ncbi:MAG: nucleotidyltransferase family protein [Lachnospiraceae bacterium]|nr:nucleotidyltransferase family protein [Lachnospiraceae bacterium]
MHQAASPNEVSPMTPGQREFLEILKHTMHPVPNHVQYDDTIDWTSVFGEAVNQNLLPLIYNAASDYPGFSEFDEAHPENMMHTVKMVSAQAQRTSAFLALYRAFLEAGISPIVVKGIVCRSLYGELQDFRLSGDEDILIEPKDFEAVDEVLNAHGYHTDEVADRDMATVQEVTFCNEETGLTVEVHLNPFGESNPVRSKMNMWFRDSFASAEALEMEGVQLRVLSPTENLLFLLFHAFKHFLAAGMGVRLVLDALLYMEKYSDCVDWKDIIRALEDVRATTFAADLIAIGNKYLGFDLAIEGLNQPVSPDELLEDMLLRGTFGVSTQIDADVARFTELAVEGKRGSKITDTFYLIFPSWDQWKSFKPYLVDRPWMLPVEWFRRVGRYLRKRKAVDLSESRRIAERRIELMKRYGVV